MKLTDYIAGNRKGREARRIEREAMDDPFLHDALEGYDAVKGNPTEAIDRIERRIQARTGRPLRRIYRGIAAALLLCAGLGGYLLTHRNSETAPGPVARLRDTFRSCTPADSVVLAAVTPEKALSKEKTPGSETRRADREKTLAVDESLPAKQTAESPENKISRPVATADRPRQPVLSEDDRPQTGPSLQPIADAVPDQADESVEIHSFAQIPPAESPEKLIRKTNESRSVQGRITDKRGRPLIGVSVTSEPGKSTLTDSDGHFSLDRIPGNDTLEVTHLGYYTEKIPADTSAPIQIALRSDPKLYEQCIVVGYGTQQPGERQEDVGRPVPADGHKAYLRYLDENKVYRNDQGVPHGKVTLRFRVDYQGRPMDIKVVRSLGAIADREAVRLLQEGPDWIPGDLPVRLDIRF